MLTADEVRALIREQIGEGTVFAWAVANKLSPSQVGDVLRGQEEPGPKITQALGLRRVVRYEKVAP